MKKEAKVSGPSQANETPDPKWERVKREIKAELLPKEMKQPKSGGKKPRSAFINDYA